MPSCNSLIPSDPKEVVDTLNCGLEMVMSWMRNNKLALNSDKMEVLLVGYSLKVVVV